MAGPSTIKHSQFVRQSVIEAAGPTEKANIRNELPMQVHSRCSAQAQQMLCKCTATAMRWHSVRNASAMGTQWVPTGNPMLPVTRNP